MKRTMIVTAAALLLAGASYPLFALDSKKTTEPAKAVEKKDEGKATEVKPSEPMAKDATSTTSTVTETKEVKPEVKPNEPMVKGTTTTTSTVTETKPTTPAPSTATVAPAVTDNAKEVMKDKVVDTAKDKAMDAATSGVKAPSVPGVK